MDRANHDLVTETAEALWLDDLSRDLRDLLVRIDRRRLELVYPEAA